MSNALEREKNRAVEIALIKDELEEIRLMLNTLLLNQPASKKDPAGSAAKSDQRKRRR